VGLRSLDHRRNRNPLAVFANSSLCSVSFNERSESREGTAKKRFVPYNPIYAELDLRLTEGISCLSKVHVATF
jgi:hypothetical protein